MAHVGTCDEHSVYVAGCEGCKERSRTKRRHAYRDKAYGRWQPAICDATPAREHIAMLRDEHGMSLRQIAEAVPHGHAVVNRIANGSSSAHRRTVAAICAVQPAPLKAERPVPAIGTSRRLQALAAIGFNADHLAALLHAGPEQVREWRRQHRPEIRARWHRAIAGLYERISGTPGPCDATRAMARANDWPPPLVWDDERIDDPTCKVRYSARQLSDRLIRRAIAGEVAAAALNDGERTQVVEHLTAQGWTDLRIANHLNWASGGQPGRRAFKQWRTARNIAPGSRRIASINTQPAASECRTNERKAA